MTNPEPTLREVLDVVIATHKDVQILKKDVQVLKEDVRELKGDVGILKKEMTVVTMRLDGSQHNQDQMIRNQERLEDRYERTDQMTRDIWMARDKVKVQVTWDFIWKAVMVNGSVLATVLVFFLK